MSVTINNRFSVLLAEKQVKERRKISMAEVAESTGISRQALYRWESNSIERYETNTINALCEYFGVGPGQLFEHVPDDKKKK